MSERLALSWANNQLTITGGRLPGGPLEVWYLEAFCRPGSTDRDWTETVIPHHTDLIRVQEDGSRLELLSRLADGVTIYHLVSAGTDEVDFRLEIENPGETSSQVHWGQPCLRAGRFSGMAQDPEGFIPRCFIFLEGRLAHLPTQPWATQARYTPGQVWRPVHVPPEDVNPRPLSPLVPSNGLIGCLSGDERLILATAWQPWQELFLGIFECIHADFRIAGVAPGEHKRARGKIYIVENDVDGLLARYRRDFPEHAGQL